jgi:hypothetical protein
MLCIEDEEMAKWTKKASGGDEDVLERVPAGLS